jgi:hypothetical protein
MIYRVNKEEVDDLDPLLFLPDVLFLPEEELLLRLPVRELSLELLPDLPDGE